MKIRCSRLVLGGRCLLMLIVLLGLFIFITDLINTLNYGKPNVAYGEFKYWRTLFTRLIGLLLLTFTLWRIISLITKESLDLIISGDQIVVFNIVTRKKQVIDRGQIRGISMEPYYWNFIRISGIRPLIEYPGKMVVLYSKFRAIYHLKSINYFGGAANCSTTGTRGLHNRYGYKGNF